MSVSQQFRRFTHHWMMVAATALLLTACGGSNTIDLSNNRSIDEAIEAATGPLEDLNLRRQEIPPLLVKAATNPYASIRQSSCNEVRTELAALDSLLGPDMEPQNIALVSGSTGLIDHLSNMSDIEIADSDAITTNLVDSAATFAQDSLLSLIHSKTNIMPFRSIIRRISGASEHATRLSNAYQAGKLRRAYLKGVAEMRFGSKCLAKPIVIEANAQPPT